MSCADLCGPYTDTGSWREAVKLAVREIRRLGLYGLTESELQRYKQASLGEVIQGAAQAGQKGHEDVLSKSGAPMHLCWRLCCVPVVCLWP